ncbi:hypothetical protein [Streptomyces laurentii]|uniref:hypothetical protein n=1 Tax=Streptomyces laurentii TaxID=39478 RepID=UPI0033FF2AF5
MSLAELEKAIPQLLGFRSPTHRGIDWGYIAREVGAAPPPDFVELSEKYPSFTVDEFLSIHIPDPGEERFFVRSVRERLEVLGEFRDAGMAHGYVPFPEPHGLYLWGDSIDGDYFYWKTGASRSDPWTILVEGANADWCEYDGSLTSYLAGLVRGTIPPDGLPPDFPGRTPVIDVD